MCSYADSYGKDKAYAGKDNGHSCNNRSCTWSVGIYEPFVKFAGAGATVPLTGFGNVLWNGMKKAIDEQGFLGLFTGGFTSCAVGVSAALIFGFIASLIFEPRMKKE